MIGPCPPIPDFLIRKDTPEAEAFRKRLADQLLGKSAKQNTHEQEPETKPKKKRRVRLNER